MKEIYVLVLISLISITSYIMTSDSLVTVISVRDAILFDSQLMRAAGQGLSLAQLNLKVNQDDIDKLKDYYNNTKPGSETNKEIKDIRYKYKETNQIIPLGAMNEISERTEICCEIEADYKFKGELINKKPIIKNACGRLIRFKPTLN